MKKIFLATFLLFAGCSGGDPSWVSPWPPEWPSAKQPNYNYTFQIELKGENVRTGVYSDVMEKYNKRGDSSSQLPPINCVLLIQADPSKGAGGVALEALELTKVNSSILQSLELGYYEVYPKESPEAPEEIISQEERKKWQQEWLQWRQNVIGNLKILCGNDAASVRFNTITAASF